MAGLSRIVLNRPQANYPMHGRRFPDWKKLAAIRIEVTMPRIEFGRSTSHEDALTRAADECGVEREYWDIFGRRHEVSEDVRRRILQALGWNVSSFEAVEQERAKRFEQNAANVIARTLVISETDKSIAVTVPVPSRGSISFEILLEDGQSLAGTLEISQLRRVREIVIGERRWIVYELSLPAEVPLGYHTLKISIDDQVAGHGTLIVCPNRAYLPGHLAAGHLAGGGRMSGFNVALYGLRSDRNWGCGDFSDLRGLIDWARAEIGFSFIGLNPLHALHNRAPYNTSPYLPLSIFYKNLIYIDIEETPEFKVSSCARRLFASPKVQQTIRDLREAEFIDYEGVDRLKRRFLKLLFRAFRRTRIGASRKKEFAAYCEREGDLLRKFALYCALDELLHKQDGSRWTWRDWPMEYQSPETKASQIFEKQHALTVEFYKYVQFVIDEQLSAAQTYAKDRGMGIGLYHDLALAADNCGSDLWAHRKFYVDGCRVGSPPDDFSPNGQDWSFPPPNAAAHRDDGYRLYRESIRKIVRHGGALRIDHVMRLFRLFWIPDGAQAPDGIYVRDHATDLMRILALESVRSKNVIIGEDLGTVTDEIRDTLSRFGVLSYRLFYFEKHYPDKSFKHSYEYPRQALVSSTTHDLPTIAGFWTFRDIEARRAAGLAEETEYRAQIEDRKREKQRMLDILHSENLLPHYYARNAAEAPEMDGSLHNAIVGFLAQAPSMLLLLNQEDFTKETEQQNLPCSTAEYPNWRRKMKVKIEDLSSSSWKPFSAMFRDQLTRTDRRCY
ncbi:MAG: 4-alpha-glucanotransferase [Bryobacteraceae bacterium]